MTSKQRFDEFIVEYMDNARKLAEIYVKDPLDAEDVLSESIEKAIRNVGAINDANFLIKRWFNRIVINTAIDHLRKQPQKYAPNKNFTTYHVDDFSHLYIEGLLELLPERDRQIVSKRFCDNYTISEIASELGMNENTVATRIHRSLKKLKLEIADEGINVNAKKDKRIAKSVTAIAIALLLSAALVFNLSPTLSAAAYDIPILGDIVRVITFNRFEYKDGGYEAEILVPEIRGLLDPELEARLNAEFSGNADDLIRSFEATILEFEELSAEPGFMSIKADYTVKTDNDRLLSLDTYIFSDTGNFVVHKFYTIDKRNSTLVSLSDLFKPDADYVTPISEYLISEMLRQNAEEDAVFDVGDSMFALFTEIRPDHNFYITDGGELVICFDKYEVAAGTQGSPEFVIPHSVLEGIADSDLLA